MSSPTGAQATVAEVVDVVDLDADRLAAGTGRISVLARRAASRRSGSVETMSSIGRAWPCDRSRSSPSFLLTL
jgi:hypothetical protein